MEDVPVINATARAPTAVWVWITVGILLRLALASISIGTNDATTFYRFTTEIHRSGLLRTYSVDPDFNHPPLPALWALLARKIAGGGVHLFSFIFKLAPIGADAISIYLIWKIWKSSAVCGAAVVAAAGFALSLASVLVTGFHCNTDPCYAMLCLLSVYLMERHRRFCWAGLALAAAINVKLIPVLLIPPLLLSCRNGRDAWRFLLGLSVGVIPFIPAIYVNRLGFTQNVLNYGSVIDRWGIPFFLMGWRNRSFDPTTPGGALTLYYSRFGRLLIPVIVLVWAILARRYNRWNRYQISAVTLAVFLIMSPGFGAQYTAMIGPLLFATAPGWAMAYACSAGVFLAVGYNLFWNGKFPIYAFYTDQLSVGAGMVGMVAWLVLIGFVIRILSMRAPIRA
ncbi:MAG TPA: glycosyltransferase 87 family protein [Tepidisphaeraceae bacterium]|jgi:hypothetical protein|nr:glycosyltransferase 87 family protein [Tepidisphaeraceae bacterium]